jgi:hypothetical protein
MAPDALPLTVTTFADPELGIWGVAFGESSPAVVAIDGEPLEHALTFAASEVPVITHGPLEALEPCTFSGPLTLGGETRQLSVPAVRATFTVDRKLGSARLVGTWFPSGASVVLLARRPAKAAGQDHDQIEVAVAGLIESDPETAATAVFDPRLSTTYGADGAPQRFGIELWLGQDEDGDQRPLRVGGEALPGPEIETFAGASVGVHPLRARVTRGEGLGMYLLMTPS